MGRKKHRINGPKPVGRPKKGMRRDGGGLKLSVGGLKTDYVTSPRPSAQDRSCLNDNAQFVRRVSLDVLVERFVENY